MKQKIVIGIVALFIILAAVSTMNAISDKDKKYKSINDPSIAWTVSNMQAITSIMADEIGTGGEFIEPDGTLKEYVGVRYYVTYNDEFVVPHPKVNILYIKDAINPDNNNVLKKEAIISKALELYNWNLPLQNIRYNKKVPGNQ